MAGVFRASLSLDSCFMNPAFDLLWGPSELSRIIAVIKNWKDARSPKRRNTFWVETRLMMRPPTKFPRTPPTDKAIQTNDWSSPSPEDGNGWRPLEEVGRCLLASATMASFATSAIEAPRLLRRRYVVKIESEMLDSAGIAIANHDIACKKAASPDEFKLESNHTNTHPSAQVAS